MPRYSHSIIENLYTREVLSEMNLGANADTSSEGLGSPIHTNIHKASDYHTPAVYCAKCGKFIEPEDEEQGSTSELITSEEYHDLQFAITNLRSIMNNQPYNTSGWDKERSRIQSLESIYKKLAKLNVVS